MIQRHAIGWFQPRHLEPVKSQAPAPLLLLQKDLPSLVAATPVIVVGAITKVEAGRVAAVGEDRLEFNDISIRIERLLRGKLSDPFVLEQVAHVEKVVTPGIGPPYRVGERYLLFLQPGEGRRFIPVAQGRFRIENGGLVPLDSGPAADALKGMSEEQVLKNIASMAR
jgi:hypothetical protein